MFDGDLSQPVAAPPAPASRGVRGDLAQSSAPARKKPEGAAYNAAELAEMKLPGYPGTERGVQMRAETENWPSQPRMSGSIGRRGVEYPLKTLPVALRDLIIGRLARDIAPSVTEKAVAGLGVPAELADWQRDVRDARAAICAEAERLSIAVGSGLKAACIRIAAAIQAGEASPEMAALARRANHKAGGETARTLSARTIERWLQARAAGGVNALAPKNGGPQAVEPAWLPTLLALYRTPQKRTLKGCLRDLPQHWTPPAGQKYPSETCAREWLARYSAQSRNKGRMGPRALLALQAFWRRDTSALAPLDVTMADGHTFRAMVAHPVTGKPFQPEVMAVIDAATRKVVGWSAGIAESTTVVMDGIRHAVTTHGVPAILYTDNGSGFVNEAVSDEVTGFYARIGMMHERAQAYRAQARGLIERPNATIWRASAKKLPSYCGRDMDKEAGRVVARKIEKDIKERGASPVMLGWDEFLVWLGGEVAAYNARPHRSLPKTAQGDKGDKRHMTPDEAWTAKVAEHRATGWDLTTVSTDEAADLFRPHLRRVCRRGEVKLPWGVYFAAALTPFHGEEVLVAYEVQDGGTVWVKNLDGRLICTAARGGNVTPFMPTDKVTHARIKRAEGQAKRLAGKLADIREEAFGAGMITITPTGPVLELTAEEVAAADAEIAKLDARRKPQEPDGDERPNFADDAAWAAWLLAAPHRATPADCAHLADLLDHRATRDWWRAEGLDLDALADIAAQNQGIKAYA